MRTHFDMRLASPRHEDKPTLCQRITKFITLTAILIALCFIGWISPIALLVILIVGFVFVCYMMYLVTYAVAAVASMMFLMPFMLLSSIGKKGNQSGKGDLVAHKSFDLTEFIAFVFHCLASIIAFPFNYISSLLGRKRQQRRDNHGRLSFNNGNDAPRGESASMYRRLVNSPPGSTVVLNFSDDHDTGCVPLSEGEKRRMMRDMFDL